MVVVSPAPDATTRYELLETLRAFGRARLHAQDAGDAMTRRMAVHYTRFVEDAGFHLRGPEEDNWGDRLMLELDNLRATIAWSLDQSDDTSVDLSIRMLSRLPRVGTFGFGFAASEIGMWALRASSKSSIRRPASALDHSRAATILGTAAWTSVRLGDPVAARELAEAAMRHALKSGDRLSSEIPFTALSMVEAVSGDPARALEVAQDGLRLLESIDADPGSLVTLHTVSAAWASACGDQEKARSEANQAITLGRQFGSPSLLALALFTLGLALEPEDPRGALTALEESLERTRGRRTTLIESRTLATIAYLRARLGDLPGAFGVLREGISNARVGQPSELVACIDRGVEIFSRAGAPEVGAVLVGIATRGELASVNTGIGALRVPQRDERLREALGDAEFEEAATRGAAMSPEEIAEYALAEIDRMLDVAARSPTPRAR